MHNLFVILLFALLAPDVPYRPIEKVEATQVSTIRGIASYYSRSGCIGCSKTLTMANGEPLDDSKMTIAFQRTELNRMVIITNLKNGKTVQAKVTDRGGFERLPVPKIADLGLSVKNVLECDDLCNVEIMY
jgi:hypothetical protein